MEASLSLAATGRGEPRSYVVFDTIYHPNLATMQYGAFFNLCRLKGVAFDLQERVGSAFMLVDSLAGGMLGVLCVGRTPRGALKAMNNSLQFISDQVGSFAQKSEFDDEQSNFAQIFQVVKGLLKDKEKEDKRELRESRRH